MIDIYQGDPKIYIDENGAEFKLPGNVCQPEMEQGIENLTSISLFTQKGWEGNFYFKNVNNQVGSDYEVTAKKPITLSNLELLRQSTIKALENETFGAVESEVTALENNQVQNIINIKPPGRDVETIIATRNGVNWLLQAEKGNS